VHFVSKYTQRCVLENMWGEKCCAWRLLKKNVFHPRKNQNLVLSSSLLFASTHKVHRSRSVTSTFWNIWQIRSLICFSSARRLLPADLLKRWPQVCRVKITFTLLLTNQFVSTLLRSMKSFVNWIPPGIRVRSRNTQPHLRCETKTLHVT